jgi:hypothetical protein
VNSNLVVDPALRLGDVTETITVQARPSDIEVETRRMGVGTVVEQERILELPLNARQVTDLITLSGAAVQVPNSVIGNMVTGVNISVAGGGRWGGLANQTADGVLDDVYQDQSGDLNTQYFNRDAFALPALGSYGNTDFFSVRGFATWNLDVAVSRIFSLGTHRIEARWEVFNPFNAALPNDPTTALSSPAFGRVTTMRDPRIMQFAAKYVF